MTETTSSHQLAFHEGKRAVLSLSVPTLNAMYTELRGNGTMPTEKLTRLSKRTLSGAVILSSTGVGGIVFLKETHRRWHIIHIIQ